MFIMQRDGFIAKLIDEIGLPVPLEAWRVKAIEHRLKNRIRHRTDQIEFRTQRVANWLKGCLRLVPHMFFRWRFSGKGGPGGTIRKAKNPLICSEAVVMNSRYQRMISAARSSGQSIGPA